MIKISSHKDIEELIKSWDNFLLTDMFQAEDGSCSRDGKDDPDFDEPCPRNGNIYRFILSNSRRDFRYGLVNSEGKVTLNVMLKPNMQGKDMLYSSRDIETLVREYTQLVISLKKAGVDYQRDSNFEQTIIESAKDFISF